MTYAVLYHPGHNRVYFETSLRLAEAEFVILSGLLSVPCENLQNRRIQGVSYLTFDTPAPLTGGDLRLLSGLSFAYALFSLKEREGEIWLRPIELLREDYVDSSMSSMLKYTGKTNELFTRMMLNIAYASQPCREGIRLLDPVAGKGTTLYEGLIRGYDSYGIEIGEKVTLEAYHFIKRFLEHARYKFTVSTLKCSGPGKSFTALRHTFLLARTKEEKKAGQGKTMELIAGDSRHARAFFQPGFFHMIVGDLPYGIQHGNVTNEKQSSFTRNPSELVQRCLPAWKEVLRPGGVILLSWNSNVLSREKLAAIFSQQGMRVLEEGAYCQLEHQVDQSIRRDILVAVKQ